MQLIKKHFTMKKKKSHSKLNSLSLNKKAISNLKDLNSKNGGGGSGVFGPPTCVCFTSFGGWWFC